MSTAESVHAHYGHPVPRWGKAKRDPDWYANDDGTITHRSGKHRMRRTYVEGVGNQWVTIKESK